MTLDAQERVDCELGEGFVKICSIKNAPVGDGRELEHALDDAFGTG